MISNKYVQHWEWEKKPKENATHTDKIQRKDMWLFSINIYKKKWQQFRYWST